MENTLLLMRPVAKQRVASEGVLENPEFFGNELALSRI